MIFYTLDRYFNPNGVVDSFESGIWTERYSTPGDVSIVCAASQKNIDTLSEGTFLSTPDSHEVMIVDTQSIEKGVLTVSGKSLLEFLKQRIFRFSVNHYDRDLTLADVNEDSAIEYIITNSCLLTASATLDSYGLNGDQEVIDGIYIINENPGTSVDGVVVSVGSVGSAIEKIATDNDIGVTLSRYGAAADGEMMFRIYRGLDHTSLQSVNDLVRFSPIMGTLTSIKELHSSSTYKNVAYAWASNLPAAIIDVGPGIAYQDGGQYLTGFDRRVLLVLDTELNMDTIDLGDAEAQIEAYLTRKATDALANNTFTKLVDGEIVPQSEYSFGEHYGLGDIIELQGYSGQVQRARVTEYIRSQDKTGERAYPTVAVVGDDVT